MGGDIIFPVLVLGSHGILIFYHSWLKYSVKCLVFLVNYVLSVLG